MNRLIVIRGNSGSGKTTIAKKLHEFLQPHYARDTNGVMLVSQDVIRRDILRTKDTPENPSIQMIKDTAIYGHNIGYDVIIEGILVRERYGFMLHELIGIFDDAFVYYFDISLEETFKRHKTKPNSHEFGEDLIRKWYVKKDTLGTPGEKLFTDKDSEDEIFLAIIKDLRDK